MSAGLVADPDIDRCLASRLAREKIAGELEKKGVIWVFGVSRPRVDVVVFGIAVAKPPGDLLCTAHVSNDLKTKHGKTHPLLCLYAKLANFRSLDCRHIFSWAQRLGWLLYLWICSAIVDCCQRLFTGLLVVVEIDRESLKILTEDDRQSVADMIVLHSSCKLGLLQL